MSCTSSTSTDCAVSSSTSILIADPREPTAVLTLNSTRTTVRPGEPFEVQVTTETYTGNPVAGAKVKVRWTYNGIPKPFANGGTVSSSPMLSRRRSVVGIPPSVSQETITGETEIVTDEQGVGKGTLDFKNITTTGGNVQVTADWQGPTGELLTQTDSYPVAFSEASVSATPTSNSALPGEEMSYFITVTGNIQSPSLFPAFRLDFPSRFFAF